LLQTMNAGIEASGNVLAGMKNPTIVA